MFSLATIATILFFMVVGGIFVAITFCGDALNLIALSSFNTQLRHEAAHQLQEAITGTPIHLITIQLIAIGGYLIIRRAIEQEMDLETIRHK